MKRFKVRFHLARGDNYMKWQVFDLKHNTKEYYEPDTYSLVMRGCRLGNQPSTSKKIFEGADKTVCAWVSCDSVRAYEDAAPPKLYKLTQYKYNPRKNPHWFTDANKNVDGLPLISMVTHKRNIYG
jgi:hypothetical protein